MQRKTLSGRAPSDRKRSTGHAIRCHLEQGLLELAESKGTKAVRVVETADAAFVLEATFRQASGPYYLATARDPYNPRAFQQINTAIQKARELFALREVTVVFQ